MKSPVLYTERRTELLEFWKAAETLPHDPAEILGELNGAVLKSWLTYIKSGFRNFKVPHHFPESILRELENGWIDFAKIKMEFSSDTKE